MATTTKWGIVPSCWASVILLVFTTTRIWTVQSFMTSYSYHHHGSPSSLLPVLLSRHQHHQPKRIVYTTSSPPTAILRSSSSSSNNNDSSSLAKEEEIEEDTVLWNVQQLETLSNEIGIELCFTTIGPGYRVIARAKHNPEELILGYVEGFIRPAGKILHLDKMEVYQSVVKRAKDTYPTSTTDNDNTDVVGRPFDLGGVSFGIGLMMGYRCLLHALDKGCTSAEFLAIDDDDFIHKRLVRYYRRVGFQIVKYVGEDIKDIPDRLIWGGVGTLMREDISILISKWNDTLQLIQKRRRKRSQKSN